MHIDKYRQGEFSRGKRNKMRPRSERGILVGHDMGASAYIVYLPRMNRVVTSSAVVFEEFPIETPFLTERPEHWTSPAPGVDDAAPIVEEEIAPDTASENLPEEQPPRNSTFDGRDIPRPPMEIHRGNQEMIKGEGNIDEQEIGVERGPRRSTRTRKQFDPQSMPSGTQELEELTRQIEQDSDDDTEGCNFTFCVLSDTGITMEEAMAGPDANRWKQAIEVEDRGLEDLKVITTEECPVKIKPLNTRYVLSKKRDPNGSVERYKAGRVVQGFHQVYGRDFLETFAHVVGFDTIRVLLKLAVNHGWGLRSMDFTQAYLNAPLKEIIYVKNLDGSTGKLNKALYGLKQAGYEWNKTLTEYILKRKQWKKSEFDECLLYAWDGQRIAILAIYVDDLLMTGS